MSDNPKDTILQLEQKIVLLEGKVNELKKNNDASNIQVVDKLQETIEYYENIIALMPGHVYWKNKEGVVLGCNNLQAYNSGYANRSELIGRGYDLVEPEQVDAIRQTDQEVMRTGKALTVEESATFADGKSCIFLSTKVPHYHRGKIVGVIGTSIDITDKVQHEMLQKENEVAKEKINSLERLSGIIAHELRTPLASIRLYASNAGKMIHELMTSAAEPTVENTTAKPSPNITKIFNAVKKIEDIVEKAFSLINMLLIKLDPNSKKMALIDQIAIKECVERAIELYPFQDGELKRVKIHIEDKNNFVFTGEKNLFLHVLYNLLKNSLYYTNDEQDVIISAETRDDCNELHFKDTGKGIPQEYLPHIFEQFFSKTKYGTGLGLSFCRDIMHSIGGEMTCTSVENHFTEFVLSFPKKITDNSHL